ncbi:hypothetical protein [Streptomonospora salina]|uniref:Uncharacterized protein n=1 Tax=Streptomonospora salina TaxID=104205 RepID=A0A841EBG3_9ACTN|nr:hypothetical protein [Streptomonospora salina]MBB5998403.1 hypothetical protein [Streptomonospora salina]
MKRLSSDSRSIPPPQPRIGTGDVAQPDSGAPPDGGPEPVVPENVGGVAREHRLGAPVSVHAHADVDHRRAAVYVLAAGATAAAVLLVAESSAASTYSELPRISRVVLLLPVLPAALWMAAMLRGRRGVYLFERGLVVREGRRLRAVPLVEVAALKHMPGDSREGDLKLWVRTGRPVVIPGLYTPGSDRLFTVLCRYADRHGLPTKRPKPARLR